MPNGFVHFFFLPGRQELLIQTAQARLFCMAESSHPCVWLIMIIDMRHHHYTLRIYSPDSKDPRDSYPYLSHSYCLAPERASLRLGWNVTNVTALLGIWLCSRKRREIHDGMQTPQRINCKTIQWITGVCPQDIYTEFSSFKKKNNQTTKTLIVTADDILRICFIYSIYSCCTTM